MEVGATFAGTHVHRSLGPAQLTSTVNDNINLEQQKTVEQRHKIFRSCSVHRTSHSLILMSGLEVAGIVLGALPLIISALEHYAEGYNTAKRFWSYKSEVRSLLIRINSEKATFVNTLEHLLTGIVRIDRMAEMLANVGGEEWQDEIIEQCLKDRLRGAYEVYLANVQGMAGALQKIMKKLALGPDGKVSHFSSFLIPSAAFMALCSCRRSGYKANVSEPT